MSAAVQHDFLLAACTIRSEGLALLQSMKRGVLRGLWLWLQTGKKGLHAQTCRQKFPGRNVLVNARPRTILTLLESTYQHPPRSNEFLFHLDPFGGSTGR